MLLVAMLVVAGGMTLYEFSLLNRSVHGMIENNYRSIEASRRMIEALEMEDNAFMRLLLGYQKEGTFKIQKADSLFRDAFLVAKNNITEPNEDKYILSVELAYADYMKEWNTLIGMDLTDSKIDWHFNENLHNLFLTVRGNIEGLINLNQKSMYTIATSLKDDSRRAIMPSIVAIISLLVLTLLMNFFVTEYFVSPIGKLADAVKNYRPSMKKLTFKAESDDEIKKLSEEIQHLIDRQISHTRTETTEANGKV